MKKLLIGCLLFVIACQPATPTPVAPLFPTATTVASQTPLPATVSPAPTATPEFTPTPLPRLFTDEFDSSLAGWVILQSGNDSVPNVNTENSNLILQMESVYTWVYALYGAHDYADVHIDAQFENRGGSPSAIGLVCRYSEAEGWFEFNVSTDGTYNVLYGHWLASGIADYLPIWSGPSNAIGPSGTAQEIGLRCSDTSLALYVNQQNIRNVDVSRYELLEGKIGLTVSSFENTPIIAAFDWVKVSEP
ncbi:MAG TPA: hypothetical protein VJ821_18240 [Anaerolineales bacterium]|nr:hypothetical protein [Anaerolineales bacterium]